MKKNPVLMKFGNNIRKLRKGGNLTQERLAEHSGLDCTYISGIERGIRNPSFLSLKHLAKGLNTSVSEMLRGL